MTDEERIKEVLCQFVYEGLIAKNLNGVLNLIASRIIGIGIGEQGFVTSNEDIRHVLESGIKPEGDDGIEYTLRFGRVETQTFDGKFAVVCAEVSVFSKQQETVYESVLSQSLSLIKEDGDWKICGLHASTPVVTEETIEAYPLKFADKTLQSLKEKIGVEVYQAEEQYRQAVLADTIAFYIINFTKDQFEKCQLNNDFCVYTEPGTPFESFLLNEAPSYVEEEDRDRFVSSFSLSQIEAAYRNEEREVQCEYRMKCPDGGYNWMLTIIRLITDVATGEHKGIMYVKNIDQKKKEEIEIRNRATYDSMTGALQKGTMVSLMSERLSSEGKDKPFVFLMLDVDHFKSINDTFGHMAGDQVLIGITKLLKECFAEGFAIGRLGGDEFGVFACMSSADLKLVQCLRTFGERLAAFRVPDAKDLQISCSIGVAQSIPGITFEALYRLADGALYGAKKRGGVAFAEPGRCEYRYQSFDMPETRGT